MVSYTPEELVDIAKTGFVVPKAISTQYLKFVFGVKGSDAIIHSITIEEDDSVEDDEKNDNIEQEEDDENAIESSDDEENDDEDGNESDAADVDITELASKYGSFVKPTRRTSRSKDFDARVLKSISHGRSQVKTTNESQEDPIETYKKQRISSLISLIDKVLNPSDPYSRETEEEFHQVKHHNHLTAEVDVDGWTSVPARHGRKSFGGEDGHHSRKGFRDGLRGGGFRGRGRGGFQRGRGQPHHGNGEPIDLAAARTHHETQ